MSSSTSRPPVKKRLSSRDVGIVAGTILCIVIAVLVIYFAWSSQQPQTTKVMHLPPGTYMSPKAQWILQQRSQKGSNGTPATPTNPGGGP